MMELFLSSDGKHTVHVSADTPDKLIEMLPQAKLVYEAVVRAYGGKGHGQKPTNGKANGNGETEAKTPVCPVHKTPMAYRHGRFGAFWSCPIKDENGIWCSSTMDSNGEVRLWDMAE